MKPVIDAIHHLFVPRHTNNFKAKLIHHDFLTVYLACALMVTAGISHYQSTQGSILGYATDISTQKLLDLTNRERKSANLGELTYNAKLEEAAKKKAENMFEKDYWAHYGPAGETPWQFILGSGYQYEFAGENLAKNFLFSDGVVNAWMESPTHRENLLRKDYTDVGFAVANGVINGEETTLVVQMFGKPLYPVAEAPQAQAPDSNQVVQLPADQPQNEVLAEKQAPQPAFYTMFVNVNMIFFAVLILALLLDFYFAAKLNLIHIKGKNLIHVLFIGSIGIGALLVLRGAIL